MFTQRFKRLTDLLFIGVRIGFVSFSISLIVFHQRITNIIYINQCIIRRHPGMRIWFSIIRTLGNAYWSDTCSDHHIRYVFQSLIKFLKPEFEVEAI